MAEMETAGFGGSHHSDRSAQPNVLPVQLSRG